MYNLADTGRPTIGMDANKLSNLLTGTTFTAPEGVLTARIKDTASVESGDRSSVVLWFYDQNNEPIEAHLTIALSPREMDNDDDGQYRRELIERIQQWLSSPRVGEPVIEFFGKGV